jgi:hypothetical protein
LAQLVPPSHVVVGPVVHPLQWVELFVVLISQPSPNVPLQSARPAAQVLTLQLLEPQLTPVMLFEPTELLQFVPPSHLVVGPVVHPLQWVELLVVLISQPSPNVPLQSARPELHVSTVHEPVRQSTPEI